MNKHPQLITARDRHAFAINFLRSERLPGELVAAKLTDHLHAVLSMVRDDAPKALEFTDPALYIRLRERITDLRIKGWGYLADRIVSH